MVRPHARFRDGVPTATIATTQPATLQQICAEAGCPACAWEPRGMRCRPRSCPSPNVRRIRRGDPRLRWRGVRARVATAVRPTATAHRPRCSSSWTRRGRWASRRAMAAAVSTVAKAALRTVVDGLPDGSRVGLRLYGHRVAGAGRAAGCRDTELVTPVGPLDRRALKAQIASYRAVGSTPIGRALRAAAADLPAQTPAFDRARLRRRRQLRSAEPLLGRRRACRRGRHRRQHPGDWLSGRGAGPAPAAVHRRPRRGVYRDAADADELAVALRALAARAVRTYTPVGKPIRGGATAAAAAADLRRALPRPHRRWTRIAGTPCRSGRASGSRRPRSSAAPARSHGQTRRDVRHVAWSSRSSTRAASCPRRAPAVPNLFVRRRVQRERRPAHAPDRRSTRPSVSSPAARGAICCASGCRTTVTGCSEDVLDGGSLALGVQTNIIGGRQSRRRRRRSNARRRPSVRAARRSRVLAAVVVGCLVLGVLATLCVARLRRRAS